MPNHLVDPPNNQLASRLVGEGFSCVARLTASNMEAYLFKRDIPAMDEEDYSTTEQKIVLIHFGIAELYKENK